MTNIPVPTLHSIRTLMDDMHKPIVFKYSCIKTHASGEDYTEQYNFDGLIGNNYYEVYNWCVEQFGECSKIDEDSDRWFAGTMKNFIFYKKHEAELFAIRWL
jgi:hypothetical protein